MIDILAVSTNAIIAYSILGFLGLLILGCFAILVISIFNKAKYENASLPSLNELTGDETIVDDYEDDELPSVFAIDDDDTETGDSAADELLKDMRAAEVNVSKVSFNPFGKKK